MKIVSRCRFEGRLITLVLRHQRASFDPTPESLHSLVHGIIVRTYPV